MVKKVSVSELLELVGEGATISRQDIAKPQETTINFTGFEEFLNEFRNLVEQQKQDAMRHQAEMMTLLERIDTSGVEVDMTPIKEALLTMQQRNSAPVQRPSYEFSVKRNNRGLIEGITAQPVKPTLQ